MLEDCQLAKLSVEEAQLLSDHRDVVKACENLLRLCTEFHIARLATIDISKSESLHELLVNKAKVDGMRTLMADFSQSWVRETKR